eukprot:TRINITY_DN18617_c0_g1_i3.p1 TRINITY_DN18617_c0_g1~~TRINITY_DN18617_c0_g1_i3.p1  ORF type:complete len:1563 (+),score=195.59 TRINITY_DN18617_c0_g1_i3:86-4690(+)
MGLTKAMWRRGGGWPLVGFLLSVHRATAPFVQRVTGRCDTVVSKGKCVLAAQEVGHCDTSKDNKDVFFQPPGCFFDKTIKIGGSCLGKLFWNEDTALGDCTTDWVCLCKEDAVGFNLKTSDSCSAPVRSVSECESAAKAFAKSDTSCASRNLMNRPTGCFYDAVNKICYMNINRQSRWPCSVTYECLCGVMRAGDYMSIDTGSCAAPVVDKGDCEIAATELAKSQPTVHQADIGAGYARCTWCTGDCPRTNCGGLPNLPRGSDCLIWNTNPGAAPTTCSSSYQCLCNVPGDNLQLTNCAPVKAVFHAEGKTASMPGDFCKFLTSVSYAGGGTIFSCYNQGAFYCDSDGSNPVVNCTPVTIGLQSKPCTSVYDATFTAAFDKILLACASGVVRCEWDVSVGKTSNCGLVPRADCPNSGGVRGVLLHPDDNSVLVLSCDNSNNKNDAHTGLHVYEIDSSGEASITNGNPLQKCPGATEDRSLHADWRGHVLVAGCGREFMYCRLDSKNPLGSACHSMQDPPGGCSPKGVTHLPSGAAAVACGKDNYFMCASAGPRYVRTAPPTASPTAVDKTLDLTSCKKVDDAFAVKPNGQRRGTPCDFWSFWSVLSTTWTGNAYLYACSYEGAVLCNGYGRDSSQTSVCRKVDIDISTTISDCATRVRDSTFTSSFDVVFFACDDAVVRCSWNVTHSSAHDCEWTGTWCAGRYDLVQGLQLLPDDRTLVLSCDESSSSDGGIHVCTLDTAMQVTQCEEKVSDVCSNSVHGSLSIDPWGNVIIGCNSKPPRYCAVDPASSNAVNCWDRGAQPCAYAAGVTSLPSGDAAIACRDAYYICTDAGRPAQSPTWSPTGATLHPTEGPTERPSVPRPTLSPWYSPSVSPERLRVSPTLRPTLLPSASPAAHGGASRYPSTPPSLGPTVRTVAPTTAPSIPPTAAPTVAEPRSTLDIAGIPKGLGPSADGAQLAGSASGASSLAMTLDGRCDHKGTLQRLPTPLHPTQLEIMNSVYIGCLVGNTVIVAGVALFSVIALRLLRMIDDDGNGLLSKNEIPPLMRKLPMFNIKDHEVVDIMAVVKCPSVIVLAFFVLYQGTIFSAFRLLIAPRGDREGLRRAMGGIAVVILTILPLKLRQRVRDSIRVRLLLDAHQNMIAQQPLARVRHWDPPLPDNLRIFFFLEGTMGDWVSCRRENHWISKYQAAVRQFSSSWAVSGLSVDYAVQWLLALANAPMTPSFVLCGHVRAAGCALALAQAGYIVGCQPYRRWRDNWLQPGRLIVQAFALGALATELYSENEEGPGFQMSAYLGILASIIALIKVILDILAEALLMKTGRRNELQRREWTEEDRVVKRRAEIEKEYFAQASKRTSDPFANPLAANGAARKDSRKDSSPRLGPAAAAGAAGKDDTKSDDAKATGPVPDITELDWLPLLPQTKAAPPPNSPVVPAASGQDAEARRDTAGFRAQSPPATRKGARGKRGGLAATTRGGAPPTAGRRRRLSLGPEGGAGGRKTDTAKPNPLLHRAGSTGLNLGGQRPRSARLPKTGSKVDL